MASHEKTFFLVQFHVKLTGITEKKPFTYMFSILILKFLILSTNSSNSKPDNGVFFQFPLIPGHF